MTTIFGTIIALGLGATIGTATLIGVVNNQTSPKGDSPANVTEQTEVAYGTAG